MPETSTGSPSTTSGLPSPVKVTVARSGAGAQSSTRSMPSPFKIVIEDPELITVVPSSAAQDVTVDQPQIDQPLPGQEKTAEGRQGPSASIDEGRSYGDEDIDFEGTPWADEVWQDKEALVTLKEANITIGKTLYVSVCSHSWS